MNWDDQLAPRYVLSRDPGGADVELDSGPWGHRRLGFDQETRRFVSIQLLRHRSELSHATSVSIAERVYLAGRIPHPALCNVLDYGEREERLFVVSELDEGEFLLSYLGRHRNLPLPFALDLGVQLVGLLRYLADYPRILANVTAEDLSVSLSPGQSLRLRLADLGLNRPEQALDHAQLGTIWLPQAAGLLWEVVGKAVREDPNLKFASQGASAFLDPFRSFLDLIQSGRIQPSPSQFRDLEREFYRYLHRFLEIFESKLSWPSPAECISLRPKSFLRRLLVDEGILAHWQDHNYEFCAELFSEHSNYALAARAVHTDSPIQLQILPPDCIRGPTGLESLYRKLGHPYLREHPRFLRTHFLRSEDSYTVLAEESVHGFNLAHLVERRGVLFSNEVCELLWDLHRILRDLEDVSAPEEPVTPWNLYFCFSSEVTDGQLSRCLTSLRLRDWPSFDLKLRLGATTADFTRPVQSEWEEILHRLATPGDSADASPNLDRGFAALALYMLEFRTYRNALGNGDRRPQPAATCEKLQDILEATVLRPEPSPDGRERFLLAFESHLRILTYPWEHPPSSGSSSPALAGPPHSIASSMDPAGPDAREPDASPRYSMADAAAAALRQARRSHFLRLRRLLRRERAEKDCSDQLAS